MAYLFLVFINLTSFWLWKIILADWLSGLFIILTTLLLFIEVNKKKNKFPICLSKLFIIFLLISIFFQTKGSVKASLTDISNDDRRLVDLRLREYPPVYIKIGPKTLWLPLAHWFEERKETIAFFRLSKNFSEVIDPNLYFFAGHPRERVGVKEIEKFSFILLPVFLYGVFMVYEKKKKRLWILSFTIPLAVTSVIGNYNPLGPMSLYPFFIVTLTAGLTEVFLKVKSKNISQQKLFVSGFLIVYLLTLFH